MQAHGLKPGRVVEVPSYAVAAGAVAGRALLSSSPRLTAVVAANDLVALGVLDAAAAMGLSCPGDVSVVGFNDMPFVDRLTPSLTTVRVDMYEIGMRASRLLLSLIEEPKTRLETIMIPPQLIVRGSTAPIG